MEAIHPQTYTYLDAYELAELLGLSVRTIIVRARHRPWLLPSRAELYDQELFRWRSDVVETWVAMGRSGRPS